MLVERQNKLRIISGKWRSRQIEIPAGDSVRPTPNRVREMIFNWLANDIAGANCLDAFAGSGALGFEALSRGAKSVTFVDSDKSVVKQLQKTVEQLQTTADIIHGKFPQSFSSDKLFDIVFLDPPFQQGLIPNSCRFLQNNHFLAKQALIYIETEACLNELKVPDNWQKIKHKIISEVACYLFEI